MDAILNKLEKVLTSVLLLTGIIIAETASARTVTILSIDGGGIRGLIPALILEELEARTGMHIAEMFDTIVGTSTGGIIALGLATPDEKTGNPKFSAKDLADLYENEGQRIFKSSVLRKGILRARYDSDNLEEILEKKFKNAKLSEALTNVLVTSYDIENAVPHYFASRKAKQNPAYNYYMKHAARATSAAPTYFSPAQIYSLEDKEREEPYTLVDGGIIINNPTMLGYVAAKRYFPDADNYLIVSLGTGDTRRSLSGKKMEEAGALSWVAPLIPIMMDGVTLVNHLHLENLFPYGEGSKSQYYRIQMPVPPDLVEMDKADESTIRGLKEIALKAIQQAHDVLEEIVKKVTERKVPSSEVPAPRVSHTTGEEIEKIMANAA